MFVDEGRVGEMANAVRVLANSVYLPRSYARDDSDIHTRRIRLVDREVQGVAHQHGELGAVRYQAYAAKEALALQPVHAGQLLHDEFHKAGATGTHGVDLALTMAATSCPSSSTAMA